MDGRKLKRVNMPQSFKQGGMVGRHQDISTIKKSDIVLPGRRNIHTGEYVKPAEGIDPTTYISDALNEFDQLRTTAGQNKVVNILTNDPTLTLQEAVDQAGYGRSSWLMGLTPYAPFGKQYLPEEAIEFSRMRDYTPMELLEDEWFMSNYGDQIRAGFSGGFEGIGETLKGVGQSIKDVFTTKPPVDVKQEGGDKKKDPNREYDNTVSESGKTGYSEIREENTSIPNPNGGALTYQYDAEQTPTSNIPSVVDLRYMPIDYMASSNPRPVALSGQTRPPALFGGNITAFNVDPGQLNPPLYIGVADARFNPQSLYQGQGRLPSFGLKAEAAYDRSLTPEVREDILRYTGRNISPVNVRLNPYVEVSGPKGTTFTGGVSLGGPTAPGAPSGVSYNVGLRKTFAQGGLFQNPVLSMLDRAKEMGDEMVEMELNDMLYKGTDDTFGFNFIPTDENGCEIEIVFQAQEGGYSRNQGSIFSNYLKAAQEAAAENAGKDAGLFGRITGTAVDMAKKAKENQSFIGRAVNDAMSKAQQSVANQAEEPAPQVEEEVVVPETTEAVTQPPVYSPENFYLSQTFKESNFDPNAVSSTNVHKGLGQLGVPVVTDWYFNTQEKNRIKKTSDGKFSYDGKTYNTSELARGAAQKVSANRAKNEFDYFNAPLNAEVQMWAMDDLYNASFVHKPEEDQPDEVRLAKALASYNMGRGKALSLLEKLKDNKVDIYSNTDFIVNSDYFPKETREYVAAIMYNQTPESWENRGYGSYEDALNKALANPEFQQYIDLYQTKQEGGFMKNGGVLVSPAGVFDPNYIPGKPVIVPTKNGIITMDGVNQDLVAVSDLGEIKYLPANSSNHQFRGTNIVEYPADVFYGKDGGLADWFKEEWVRIDTEGNITGPCGTMKKGKATTRCLPRKKAQSLTKAERKATARKKVRGSKKGKQFVANTRKAKVTKKDTKRG
jgi:hypothetical protein